MSRYKLEEVDYRITGYSPRFKIIDNKIEIEDMEREDGSIAYLHGMDEDAAKSIVEALEKQASFENEAMEIRDWFVNNNDCLYDSATKVAKGGFEMLTGRYKLIDETDPEAITEDIVDEIQKGILNVLDTFIDD